MNDRYMTSKLLILYAVRALAARTTDELPAVTISCVNPGLCRTELIRNIMCAQAVLLKVMRALMGWSAEEGGRALVGACAMGRESHGVHVSGGRVVK